MLEVKDHSQHLSPGDGASSFIQTAPGCIGPSGLGGNWLPLPESDDTGSSPTSPPGLLRGLTPRNENTNLHGLLRGQAPRNETSSPPGLLRGLARLNETTGPAFWLADRGPKEPKARQIHCRVPSGPG